MKINKKILSVLVVVMMIIPSITTAFATTGSSNVNYYIDRVYTMRTYSTSNTAKLSSINFDADEINGSSDSTIKQTYFVDLTLRIYNDDLSSGVATSDIEIDNPDSLGSFLYTNYTYNDDNEDYNITKGDRVSSYRVVKSTDGYLEIELKGLQYNGNGERLDFVVGDAITSPSNASLLVSTTISEAMTRDEEPDDTGSDNDDDDEHKPVEKPYVIISSYGYGGGQITAGDTFQLSMTFFNTSKDVDVSNMMITLRMPDAFMLTSSSNTFYIEELAQQGTITKTVQVTAKASAAPESHSIGVTSDFQYWETDDILTTANSQSVDVSIPVVQLDRFELSSVIVDEQDIELGDELLVTAEYVNKGRSEIYNLAATIDGNITTPGQVENIGNVLSGGKGSIDFYITPTEAGTTTGTLTLTYEDTNMQIKTLSLPYSVNVMEPYVPEPFDPGMDPFGPDGMGGDDMFEPEPQTNWVLVGAIILVVVIAGIVVTVVLVKRAKRKREEQEDADF